MGTDQRDQPARRWHELLREAKEGDHAAFARFVRASQQPLYRLCYRVLRDADLAMDALQEAYLDLFKALPQYDPARGSAMILVIARNAALRILRQNRHRHPSIDACGEVAGRAGAEDIERRDEADRLRRAIDALPPKLGEVVRLRSLCGMSLAETAEALGIPPGTVGSREHEARRKLRDMLGDDRPAGQG